MISARNQSEVSPGRIILYQPRVQLQHQQSSHSTQNAESITIQKLTSNWNTCNKFLESHNMLE